MPQEPDESRLLTPFVKLEGEQTPYGFKDFAPHPASSKEVVEVEEALTPAPKDSSVLESAISSASPTQSESETPVIPSGVLPTKKLEDAVKESGKASSESEEELEKANPTPPAPESSSPSSSSQTSPGKPTPPVVVKPPTAGKTPTQ
jgi:hypothetical protein